MALLPQKTSTFLLCLLRRISTETGETLIALEDVLQGVSKCQQSGGVYLYHFGTDPHILPAGMAFDLDDLQRHGWARLHLENPHVELTTLGMFFADLHEMPPSVEATVGECLA
jgi:hypothetical protein